MRMETLNILAQSLAPDDVNLVIVANTGRSGSTLLAQMFESIKGKTVKVSDFFLENSTYNTWHLNPVY